MDRSALEAGLSSLGLGDLRRILGGWQSVAVYDAYVEGRHVAVKVLDPELVDRRGLDARLEVLAALGSNGDVVCAPVPVAGRLVNEIAATPVGSVYAVAYRFAEGDAPDIDDPGDVAHMGGVLAEMHASMAELAPVDLPALAAFPPRPDLAPVADDLGVPDGWLSAPSPDGPRQLRHGDFSSKNVRVAGGRWRVFDFDDCGYGPIELDLANSLYFVVFGALTGPDPDPARHLRFRDDFLDGYRDRSGVLPEAGVLDHLIARRVLALASWLADPSTAPPGVRTASAEWRRTLDGFVRRFFRTARDGVL